MKTKPLSKSTEIIEEVYKGSSISLCMNKESSEMVLCMYMYVYVCMYACLCLCMYLCVCVCMYVYVCICVSVKKSVFGLAL